MKVAIHVVPVDCACGFEWHAVPNLSAEGNECPECGARPDPARCGDEIETIVTVELRAEPTLTVTPTKKDD